MRSPREETQEVILRPLVCAVDPRHILDVMGEIDDGKPRSTRVSTDAVETPESSADSRLNTGE